MFYDDAPLLSIPLPEDIAHLKHFGDFERLNRVIELRLADESEYRKAVRNRDYDMYLGSVRLTSDFDLTQLYGDYGDDMLLKLARDLRASAGEEHMQIASELCAYSAETCQVIPLVFQRRIIYSRQGSVREMNPNWTDPFRAITGWVTALN